MGFLAQLLHVLALAPLLTAAVQSAASAPYAPSFAAVTLPVSAGVASSALAHAASLVGVLSYVATFGAAPSLVPSFLTE